MIDLFSTKMNVSDYFLLLIFSLARLMENTTNHPTTKAAIISITEKRLNNIVFVGIDSLPHKRMLAITAKQTTALNNVIKIDLIIYYFI